MAKSISGILIAISIGVLIGTHSALAQESLTLRVVSFGSTNVFTDGGTGFIDTGSFSSGFWNLPSGIIAYSQPYQGDATHDYIVIDVPSISITNGPTLIITATETGFTPFPTSNGTMSLLLSNSTLSGVLTGQVNSTFIGRLSGGVSNNTLLVTNNGLTSTFSMTETLAFDQHLGSFASGSGFAEIELSTVPEPSTVALVSVAAILGTVVRRRHRRRSTNTAG
jgi:hypothetical protein